MNGSCQLISFQIEEMLGTKLRALYQRKKGRDLFDLYHALNKLDIDTEKLIYCFKEYMKFSVNRPPTRKQFLRNMEDKLKDPDFEGDIFALLRPGTEYNQDEAYQRIRKELIEKI